MAEGGLAQLIETERRLAERLSTAAAEADAIVGAATRAAREANDRFDADVAAGVQALATRITAEGDAEIATIRRTMELELTCFRALSDKTIAAIAGSLLDHALGLRAEHGGRP
ncbi:MAG TPA: hypothetical protein VFM14_11900 [Gemmatimonadales bacterium]|nr:hypothetical protein [Gemmatimonadales bacterium]